MKILITIASLLVSATAFADPDLSDYGWISGQAPVVLKTSQLSISGGSSCNNKDYEVCFGTAQRSGGSDDQFIQVKCYVPRNSTQCPENPSEANNCHLAGADEPENPVNIPECRRPSGGSETGPNDGLAQGCHCGRYGRPTHIRRNHTECSAELAIRYGQVSSSIARNCPQTENEAAQATCTRLCDRYIENGQPRRRQVNVSACPAMNPAPTEEAEVIPPEGEVTDAEHNIRRCPPTEEGGEPVFTVGGACGCVGVPIPGGHTACMGTCNETPGYNNTSPCVCGTGEDAAVLTEGGQCNPGMGNFAFVAEIPNCSETGPGSNNTERCLCGEGVGRVEIAGGVCLLDWPGFSVTLDSECFLGGITANLGEFGCQCPTRYGGGYALPGQSCFDYDEPTPGAFIIPEQPSEDSTPDEFPICAEEESGTDVALECPVGDAEDDAEVTYEGEENGSPRPAAGDIMQPCGFGEFDINHSSVTCACPDGTTMATEHHGCPGTAL